METDVVMGKGGSEISSVWVVADTSSFLISILFSTAFSTPFSNARFHNFPRGESGDDIARVYNFSVAESSAGLSIIGAE